MSGRGTFQAEVEDKSHSSRNIEPYQNFIYEDIHHNLIYIYVYIVHIYMCVYIGIYMFIYTYTYMYTYIYTTVENVLLIPIEVD